MKHLFVPYEIALAVEEKGFDEPCLGGYLPDGEFAEPDSELNTFRNRHRSGGEISAPLYQQVVDWFREEHKLDVLIHKTIEGNYYFWITNTGETRTTHYDKYKQTGIHYYTDYYEALTEAIKHAITLLT